MNERQRVETRSFLNDQFKTFAKLE